MLFYCEFQVTTNFSFLTGASHPEEFVCRAKELDYTAIGITDRNSLSGVVRAHVAAKQAGIRLVIGARLDFYDGTPSVLCYPTDRAAYGRLAQFLTLGKRRAPKGGCFFGFEDLIQAAEGQVLVVIPPSHLDERFTEYLVKFKETVKENLFMAGQFLFDHNSAGRLHDISKLSDRINIPLIATNDVHFHRAERRELQDVLTCIREHCSINEAGYRIFAHRERYLKSPEEMSRLFASYPKALENIGRILELCRFSLDELRYEYPETRAPAGKSSQEYLAELTEIGARERYPQGVSKKVEKQIAYELALIESLNYAPYFLTVQDIVNFARSRGILCQGRGSAANSVVCFCLGITAVDPTRIDLLFERFISAERNEPPDIDVDFASDRREEVIQYIYETYGRDRAGIAATVITYRKKSAIRDVGKALGIQLEVVEDLLKSLKGVSLEDLDLSSLGLNRGPVLRSSKIGARVKLESDSLEFQDDRLLAMLIKLSKELLTFPRHLGQHVGGFVITRGLLSEVVPIGNAAMDGRTFIEWDKDDIEALGILKVDVLGLGMLSCIDSCFEFIRQHYNTSYNLATVPADDSKVYDMLCQADSLGVFQVESRAQMSMLPRLKPRCFYDLVIEVAIVRPGPIQGGMVHPYLRRRSGIERVSFPSKELEEVLGKTLGVPLFQEQAMRIAVVAAGFTPGEADGLRRAMATFKRTGRLEKFKEKFITGMLSKNYELDFAERCFSQILGFGEYGFPESHAASFALLVYVSAWLKRHYPAAFAAALINNQPMGFYAPAQIIDDAKRHGVKVLPIDVNSSYWDCTLEKSAIRLGFSQIRGIKREQAEWVIAFRDTPYKSPGEVMQRANVNRSTLETLARADAFSSLGMNRREALWSVVGLDKKPLPLIARVLEADQPVQLPLMSALEEMTNDYSMQGLSLRAHPMSFLRERFNKLGYLTSSGLKEAPSGKKIRFAGLVIVRQRPGTAKGVTFLTMEDEFGFANIVIWPSIYEKFRNRIMVSPVLAIEGHVEKEGLVVHLIAKRLGDL